MNAARRAKGERPVCYNSVLRRPSTPDILYSRLLIDGVVRSIGEKSLVLFQELRRLSLRESLPVYLVGGPVRDALMGVPIKDLDFVVEGNAPPLAGQIAESLGGRALVHTTFGTATVTLDDAHVDLVTARSEVYPYPGALPRVTPSRLDDDLSRRDFTMNALALPICQENPDVVDHHGGVEDIRSGAVRALHSASFRDDPTRLLRAVRYEQRLGFQIEEDTLSWMGEAVTQGCISTVTGDRLRHEIDRTFQEENPAPALRRAASLGILPSIHPSLTDAGPMERLASVMATATAPGMEKLAGAHKSLLYLAALVYPLSPADTDAVIQRLNMPNAWAQVVRDTVDLKVKVAERRIADLALSGSQLARLVEPYAKEAVLAVSMLTESPSVSRQLGRYLEELRFVSPSLDGRKLLAMGVPSGPMMGQILNDLRNARLDGQIGTEEEERGLVQKLLVQGG